MTLITHEESTEIKRAEIAAAHFDFGAVPFANRSDVVEIDGKHYRPHANGGGLVAVTALVGADVLVEKTALVRDMAVVLGNVRVRDRAIVEGHAIVTDRCELNHDSRVGGYASLAGMVTLRRHASVGGLARLEGAHGGILVDYHARITRGHLVGPLSIS